MTIAAVAPPAARRESSATPWTGTGSLLRLALRRDRVRLSVWMVLVTLMMAYAPNAIKLAYPEEAQRQALDRPLVAFLDRTQQGAVAIRRHDLHQLRVAQLADGGEALGEDLAVAAMRSEDVIVRRQRKRHADCRGFLPDRKVCGSGVSVGDAFVRASFCAWAPLR